MNDDRSPIDDELLSAVLDGEATPEERALVDASPDARERLEQLREAAARVAEPVVPFATDVSARLLAHALDEALPATPAEVEGAVSVSVPTLLPPEPPHLRDELAARRHRGRGHGAAWAAALAGVAAAVLVIVVGVGFARSSSRDTASDTGASASIAANESATADAAAPTAGASTASGSLAQLGSLPDTAAVLARFAVLEAAGADFDHQFEAPEGGSDAELRSQNAADGTAPTAGDACPVPPVASDAGESWAAAAIAQLPSGSVIVMVDRAGGAGARVLVVDASTCTVLDEGTT